MSIEELINARLDKLESKLDQYLERTGRAEERIAQAETSVTWLKWALSLLLSLTGAAALALTRYIEN